MDIRFDANDVLLMTYERTPEDKDGGINKVSLYRDTTERYSVTCQTSQYGAHRLVFSDLDYEKCAKHFAGFVSEVQSEADSEVDGENEADGRLRDRLIYEALVHLVYQIDTNPDAATKARQTDELNKLQELIEEYQTKVEFV